MLKDGTPVRQLIKKPITVDTYILNMCLQTLPEQLSGTHCIYFVRNLKGPVPSLSDAIGIISIFSFVLENQCKI